MERVATVGKVWNVVSPQYALLAKGTFHFTIVGKFSFGKVFRLKITMGFSLVPSARHASTTVNCDFSCPVVLTNTVFAPFSFTVLADGMSNQTGVSSMFPM